MDNTYFTYFLHHYEPRLNKRVYRFLLTEGIDRYDPLRFLRTFSGTVFVPMRYKLPLTSSAERKSSSLKREMPFA